MWWRRSEQQVIKCRDLARRAHQLTVSSHATRTSGPRCLVKIDDGEPLVLNVLQAGVLRRQLKAAIADAAIAMADAEQAAAERGRR